MTVPRVLALGCFLGLLTSACRGDIGSEPGKSDAGPPSRGGAPGSVFDPVDGQPAGAAGGDGGATGVAGSSGLSGATGATGVAGSGTAGVTGVAGGPAGRGGVAGAAGSTGAPGRGGAAGTSAAAGSTGAGGGTAGAGSGDPAGWVPALIGVGYGGIRIVSRDGGKTWGDRAYETREGGDDEALLRAVAYGKGIWIATGWKLWTSTNGTTWTDHGLLKSGLHPDCTIVEGLAFKDGYFFAACTPWNSPSAVYRLTDGVAWTKYATIGDTGGHLYLNYRGGKFVVYGDNKTSFQSTDALTWTVMSGIEEATYCENAWKSETDCKDSSWFDGAYLRADWQGKISQSTNGTSFTTVYNDDQKNTLYRSRAIAAGFVAPR